MRSSLVLITVLYPGKGGFCFIRPSHSTSHSQLTTDQYLKRTKKKQTNPSSNHHKGMVSQHIGRRRCELSVFRQSAFQSLEIKEPQGMFSRMAQDGWVNACFNFANELQDTKDEAFKWMGLFLRSSLVSRDATLLSNTVIDGQCLGNHGGGIASRGRQD